MSLSDEDVARRIKAKRYNEGLKLFAATVNTIGLTVLGAAVLLPLVAGALSRWSLVWIFVAAGLHFYSQLTIRRLRSED